MSIEDSKATSNEPMSLSTREILEAALIEDFDNLATHSAYADLLMEENDPRGEYIQLRLRLEDDSLPVKERRRIEQESARLYQQYQHEWLGDLASFLLGRKRRDPEPETPNYDFTFKRGWLWELDIRDVRHSFTRVLAETPAAKMIYRLFLRNTRLRNNERVLEPLLESPYLEAMRLFQLGDGDGDYPARGGQQALSLLQKMPRIEDVLLLANGVDGSALFQQPFCRLKRLLVHFLREAPLRLLGQNPTMIGLRYLSVREFNLSHLEPLDLLNQMPMEVTRAPIQQGLDRFFESPYLLELRHLSLRIPYAGDELCRHLAQSSMLSRLEQLTLRGCGITDEGAEMLRRSPYLMHLQHLDIGANRLTQSGIDRLLETGIPFQYDSQEDMFDEDEMPF